MKIFKVISPKVRKDGTKFWIRCGSAFLNKDGSITAHLDCVPTGADVTLLIKDLDENQAVIPDAVPIAIPSPGQIMP